MQDRYVADVGDFGKYGLLRALTAPSAVCSGLTLAVLWYAVPNESHNNDGRHIEYLNTLPDGPFYRCDPVLFRDLKRIASVHRGLEAVESGHLLPNDTRFHNSSLEFQRSESRAARREKREAWFNAALLVVAGAELIFLDPDNGLECTVDQLAKNGPKYAYYSDVAHLCTSSVSLVIYHHLGRQGKALDQIRIRGRVLSEVVPGSHRLCALRFRRGSSRVFFLVSSSHHERHFVGRLQQLLTGPWSKHFVRETLPGSRDLDLEESFRGASP